MVSRRIEALIQQNFTDPVSRAMATAAAEKYSGLGDARLGEAVAQFARLNDAIGSGKIDVDEAFAQIGALAEGMGLGDEAQKELREFVQAGAGLTEQELADLAAPAAEEPAQPSQTPQAPAQPAPASPTSGDRRAALHQRNAELQREIDQHFKNAGAPQGSPEWKSYWREGGAQAARVALERLQSSADALAELADGGAAAAPEAHEEAPAGTEGVTQ
jgi:hypothetical protein